MHLYVGHRGHRGFSEIAVAELKGRQMAEFLGTVVSSSGESTAKGTWLLFFFKARRILPNAHL